MHTPLLRYGALAFLLLAAPSLQAQGAYVSSPYAFGATASRSYVEGGGFYTLGLGLTGGRGELGLGLTPESEVAAGAFSASAGFFFLREPDGKGTGQAVLAVGRTRVGRYTDEKAFVLSVGPAVTIPLYVSPTSRFDLDGVVAFVVPFHEYAEPGVVLGAGASLAVGSELLRVLVRPGVSVPLQGEAGAMFLLTIGTAIGFSAQR